MKDNKSASLFQKEQVIDSIKQSFVKLNPRVMIKNPIMFTVEVCTAIMFLVMLYSIVNDSQGSFIYNLWVFVILFITLLFANFAEAIAEARGKAQADSLRKTREESSRRAQRACRGFSARTCSRGRTRRCCAQAYPLRWRKLCAEPPFSC